MFYPFSTPPSDRYRGTYPHSKPSSPPIADHASSSSWRMRLAWTAFRFFMPPCYPWRPFPSFRTFNTVKLTWCNNPKRKWNNFICPSCFHPWDFVVTSSTVPWLILGRGPYIDCEMHDQVGWNQCNPDRGRDNSGRDIARLEYCGNSWAADRSLPLLRDWSN